MRSRYSAYALKNSSYLIATTHPENKEAIKYKNNPILWEESITAFCDKITLENLEILNTGTDSIGPFVQFQITCLNAATSKELIYKELSHFAKLDNRWLYLSSSSD